MEKQTKLEKVGCSNEIFYYGFSGKKTTIIYLNVTLKDKIKSDVLQKALEKTLICYPNLCRKIVVKGENIFYEKNEESPIVYHTSDKMYQLGTAETKYYLFRVMYEENKIILAFHHGLTDGKGMFEVSKTLLYYYYCLQGMQLDTQFKIRTEHTLSDETELEESFTKYGNLDEKPLYIYKNKGAFVIPEPYYEDENPTSRRFRLTCSMSLLLKLAKRNQTTPVPVLAMIISQSLHSLYNVGQQNITGYIPVNLRPFFHSKALNNFSLAISLPYDYRLKEKDTDIQCTVLRGIMDAQIQPENFVYRMGKRLESNEQRENMKVPAQMKQKALVEKLPQAARMQYTYLLSYIGNVETLTPLDEKIEKVEYVLPAYLAPLSILACAKGENMILNFTQNFKTDKIIKKVVQILEENGVTAIYEDLGEIQTDSFELDAVPSMENA